MGEWCPAYISGTIANVEKGPLKKVLIAPPGISDFFHFFNHRKSKSEDLKVDSRFYLDVLLEVDGSMVSKRVVTPRNLPFISR